MTDILRKVAFSFLRVEEEPAVASRALLEAPERAVGTLVVEAAPSGQGRVLAVGLVPTAGTVPARFRSSIHGVALPAGRVEDLAPRTPPFPDDEAATAFRVALAAVVNVDEDARVSVLAGVGKEAARFGDEFVGNDALLVYGIERAEIAGPVFDKPSCAAFEVVRAPAVEVGVKAVVAFLAAGRLPRAAGRCRDVDGLAAEGQGIEHHARRTLVVAEEDSIATLEENSAPPLFVGVVTVIPERAVGSHSAPLLGHLQERHAVVDFRGEYGGGFLAVVLGDVSLVEARDERGRPASHVEGVDPVRSAPAAAVPPVARDAVGALTLVHGVFTCKTHR